MFKDNVLTSRVIEGSLLAYFFAKKLYAKFSVVSKLALE